MKNEDIYNAISDIDTDILDAVDDYIESGKQRKFKMWKIGAFVAACVILFLCMIFPGKRSNSAFTITAYAMNGDGELIGTPFMLGQKIQMMPIELVSGKICFLFSSDLKDVNAKSQVRAFSFSGLETTEQNEMINRIIEEKGKAYFYYLPDEEMDAISTDILNSYTKENGDEGIFIVRITNNNGQFTAQLMDEEDCIETINK